MSDEQADQAWATVQLAQLRARSQHYPPISEQAGWAHAAVRAATVAYGEILLGNCPPSDELHEALRLLTDSVMSRCNAAIARHGTQLPTTAGGKIEYVVQPRRTGTAEPLVNGVVADPEGTRDQPHPYQPLAENASDGYCLRCGRDSRHEIHAETPGWPWPYDPDATKRAHDEAGT